MKKIPFSHQSYAQKLVMTGAGCLVAATLGMWLLPVAALVHLTLFLAAWVLAVLGIAKGSLFPGLVLFMTSILLGTSLTLFRVILPFGFEIQETISELRASPVRERTESEIIQGSAGTPVSTPIFDILVKSVEQTRRIGTMVRNRKAGHGASFWVVEWRFTNVSDRPVMDRRRPRLILSSPDGAFYLPHDSATGLAQKKGLLTSLANDSINPGTGSAEKTVFEVSSDVDSLQGWRVIVEADQRIEIALE
jgi:hypothetical protein